MAEPERHWAQDLPNGRDALNALALITRLPLPAPAFTDKSFAAASMFFPIIGLTIGMALAALARAAFGTNLGFAASFAIAVLWELLGTPIRRDDLSQPVALLAGVAAIALNAVFLNASGGLSGAALLFAPLLGRWSLVVLAVGARSADRTGQKFSPAVTFREFGIASLIAFAFVFTIGQLIGLILIVACSAVTLVLRLAFHRWQGGITWATVVGGMHVVEITALVTLAVLG